MAKTPRSRPLRGKRNLTAKAPTRPSRKKARTEESDDGELGLDTNADPSSTEESESESEEDGEEDEEERKSEEIRTLKAKLRASENQVKNLTKEQSKVAKKRYAQGRGRNKKRTLQNEDSAAQQVINHFWNKIISHHKEFDERHRWYSDDPSVPSGIIMPQITVPSGETRATYWEGVVVYPVLYKKQQLLTKMNRKQSDRTLGKIFEYAYASWQGV